MICPRSPRGRGKQQPEQGRRQQALVPGCVRLSLAVAGLLRPLPSRPGYAAHDTKRRSRRSHRLTAAPSSTFEFPGKYPSSEFQGPKVSHFQGTKPSFPCPPDRELACPSLSHPAPRESLSCGESFQTALGLFGLGPCGQSGCSG